MVIYDLTGRSPALKGKNMKEEHLHIMENSYSMKGYIDIHSHILPGVDDGARDLEQTMTMLRLAVENYIHAIICTPHYKEGRISITPEQLDKLLTQVRERCREERINIELYGGCELYCTGSACTLLEQKAVLPLASSDCVLVEFSPWEQFSVIQEGLFSIKTSGYRPVLAHVERYGCLQEEKDRILTLRDMDVLIQINAGSILEKEKYTRYLLKNRLVDFVATDSHSDGRRGPYLKACAAYLIKKYGETYSAGLLRENARRMILSV